MGNVSAKASLGSRVAVQLAISRIEPMIVGIATQTSRGMSVGVKKLGVPVLIEG